MLLQDIQHFPAVGGLRHNFEILFQSQELAQPVAEDGMVVGHHDPNFGLCRDRVPAVGPFSAALFSGIHFSH